MDKVSDYFKPLERGLKTLVFGALRGFLRPSSQPQPLDTASLTKVLFLRPDRIGDMIVSLPVFDAFKVRFPGVKIGILASPKSEPVIAGDPRFNRVFLYTKRLWRDIRTIRAIRRDNYDCVVNLVSGDSLSTLFLCRLCAPGKPRYVSGAVKFRDYYDWNYDYGPDNRDHIIDNTLKLLEVFGIDTHDLSGYATPYIDDGSRQRMRQYLRQTVKRGAGARSIGYNISSGAPSRTWAIDKARDLIARVRESEEDCHIVLFTVPDEWEKGRKLATEFADRVHPVPPGMSLREAAAVIAELDVLISPDTSLVHIARAFNVPVVGLYTRHEENFNLWRPYGQETGAVVSRNEHDIHDITVDQVFALFLRIAQAKKLATR